jgi:hypothetical protein
VTKAHQKNEEDVAAIMSRIHQNGGDFWATKDNRILKGSPFSTKEAAIMLHELRCKKEIRIGIADKLFEAWQDDGRFKVAPAGAIYPCQTIGATRVLCYLGYAKDKRVKKTFEHLLYIQQEDGGWRCNKFSFGRGPDTNHSNPGPTLEALDAFRFTKLNGSDARLEKAVRFLLWHWRFKKPVGPCQFGIGSLFMQTEFPFFRYNLFYFCYVLSFYPLARKDKRFLEAIKTLQTKLENGKIVIENPNRQISLLNFCRKGEPSNAATSRFKEILRNLETDHLGI